DEARAWMQGDHFDATMNYGFNRACYGFFGQETLDTSQRPGGFKLKRLDARRFARQVDRMLTSMPGPSRSRSTTSSAATTNHAF
ncbi:MAG: hypothetical protein P8169_15110, partial [Chloroflexota bacterium]